MAQLANFEQAAQLGFSSGKGQAQVNPLGSFVKGLLAERQKREASQQELTSAVTKIGLGEIMKQNIQSRSPLNIAKTNLYQAKADKAMFGDTTGISDVQKFKRQVWSQASADAFKESGGGLFAGIGKGKATFVRRRKEIYDELLIRMGVIDGSLPEDIPDPDDIDINDLGEDNEFNEVDSLSDMTW